MRSTCSRFARTRAPSSPRWRGQVCGRIHVGVRTCHRNLLDELGMGREDGTQPAVAGCLGGHAECRAPESGPGSVPRRPRSAARQRVASGRPVASRSARTVSARSPGWSPRTISAAVAVGEIDSSPTDSELDRPRPGSGSAPGARRATQSPARSHRRRRRGRPRPRRSPAHRARRARAAGPAGHRARPAA